MDLSDLFRFSEGKWPVDEALVQTLHQRGYRDEGERFQTGFDQHVRDTLIEARQHAGPKSRMWFAWQGSDPVGCTAMIDRGDLGQLRWVVVVPEVRGHAVGKHLFETAISYARDQSWKGVYLETTDQLDASMSIYRKAGFVETLSEQQELWNGPGQLIRMFLQF